MTDSEITAEKAREMMSAAIKEEAGQAEAERQEKVQAAQQHLEKKHHKLYGKVISKLEAAIEEESKKGKSSASVNWDEVDSVEIEEVIQPLLQEAEQFLTDRGFQVEVYIRQDLYPYSSDYGEMYCIVHVNWEQPT